MTAGDREAGRETIGRLTDQQNAIVAAAIYAADGGPDTPAEIEATARHAYAELEKAGCPIPLDRLRWALKISSDTSRDMRAKAARLQAMWQRIEAAADELQEAREFIIQHADVAPPDEDEVLMPDDYREERILMVEASRKVMAAAAEIVALWDTSTKLVAEIPQVFLDDQYIGKAFVPPSGLGDWVESVREADRNFVKNRRALAGWDRAVKLASRREQREQAEAFGEVGIVAQGRRCSMRGCQKPAKVDDLCKRHAHAAGIMPHGKIGEG